MIAERSPGLIGKENHGYLVKIYEGLKKGLPREEDEGVIQLLANIIKGVVIINGLGPDRNNAKFLRLLYKEGLLTRPVTGKQLQVNKALMNLVVSVGHLLGKDCWLTVWSGLQDFDHNCLEILTSPDRKYQDRVTDIQIQAQLLESICTGSQGVGAGQLLVMVETLFQLAFDHLESRRDSRVLFSLGRLEKIFAANLHRADLLWTGVSDGLMCLVSSKFPQIRNDSLQTLCNVIGHALRTGPASLSQDVILQPISKVIQCGYPELKTSILSNLKRLIVDSAHSFNEQAWTVVVAVLEESSLDPFSLRKAFECIEITVETYLQDRPLELVARLLYTISNVKAKSEEANVKYMCLNKLWQISDLLKKKHGNPVPLQSKILAELSIIRGDQEMNELRQSSMQILGELMYHNCEGFSQTQYEALLFRDLCPELLRQARLPLPEELCKSTVSMLAKVTKRYYQAYRGETSPADDLFLRVFALLVEQPHLESLQLAIKALTQIITGYPGLTDRPGYHLLLVGLAKQFVLGEDGKRMKMLVTYLPQHIYQLILSSFTAGYSQVFELLDCTFFLYFKMLRAEV